VQQIEKPSTFVTVLAWIFIILSGFGVPIAALQNVMVWTVFSSPEFTQSFETSSSVDMPSAAIFLTSHMHLFFFAVLLFLVFTLVSSIGLLKRKHWARFSFVGLMLFGILWNLGGLVIQFSIYSSMQQEFSAMSTQGGPNMDVFMFAMAAVAVLFAVALSVLLGWIAKRLLSPEIAAEFH